MASKQGPDPLSYYPPPTPQPFAGPSNPMADLTKASVYTQAYSGISVFECMIRGIAVMRRRTDSWMNATQILKVAGIEKGRRTKILEKEIIPNGLHEKVQGGYGKYQGTWIPLERGIELATQYGVNTLLAPIVDPSLNDETYAAQLPSGRQSSPAKPSAGTSSATPVASRPPTTIPTTIPSGAQSRQIFLQQQPVTSPFLPGGGSNVIHYPIPPAHHGGRTYNGQGIHSSAMMTPSAILAAGHGSVRAQPGAFYGYYDPGGAAPAPGNESALGLSDRKRARGDETEGEGRADGRVLQQTREDGARGETMMAGYHPAYESYPSGRSDMGPPSSKRIRTDDAGHSLTDSPYGGPPLAGYPPPFQHHSSLDQHDQYSASASSSGFQSNLHHAHYRVPTTASESAAMQRFADSLVDGEGNALYTMDAASAGGASTPGHLPSCPPGMIDPSLKDSGSIPPSLVSQGSLHQYSPLPVQDSLAPHTRLANKPTDPAKNPDPVRQRAILIAFFERQVSSSSESIEPPQADDPEDPSSLLSDPTEPFDPNLVIDPQGHTALHWACALARPHLVNYLLEKGADPHRGNHAGETPLMRCILATNNYDQRSFPLLLALADSTMALSIRTIDRSHRSVLHHIALLAGVPGRAGAARYYMMCLLEWMAKNEGIAGMVKGTEGFKNVIDGRDVNGDTALVVSARVGNRSLVKLLVEAGAEKGVVNKLGLKAGDYGIEEELLEVSAGEVAVDSLRETPSVPLQKSKDVLADLAKTIETLNTSFLAELKVKEDALAIAQTHVVGVTRSLASARKMVFTLEGKLGELDQVSQRIKNVQRALDQEDMFDWSGRLGADGQSSDKTGPSFQVVEPTRGEGLPVSHRSSAEPGVYVGPDPEIDPSKATDPRSELIELRRIRLWQSRVEKLLEERIESVQAASAEKLELYKKVIMICTGTPLEMVEEALDKLVDSIEGDGDVGKGIAFTKQTRP